MKVSRKVCNYFLKQTVRAKYDRNMDTAVASGIFAVGELLRMPTPLTEPEHFALGAACGIIYLRSLVKSFKHFMGLQPIRKRAIAIKNASKLSAKNLDKMV